jgi:hypothetical protein
LAQLVRRQERIVANVVDLVGRRRLGAGSCRPRCPRATAGSAKW